MDSETEPDAAAELLALRALLDCMSLPEPTPEPPPSVPIPFEPLPPLEPAARRALEAAALHANERYLATFIEAYSFCPFSRGGRARGVTARYVHYADRAELEPFLAWLARAASDPGKAVIQLILPMLELPADEFSRFCHALTAAGNARLREGAGGADVFAVAPLHPELPYTRANALSLIPLLRRAPDPTIQWVRLDALAALYAGRTGDSKYVDPSEIAAFLQAEWRPSLFERIAQTNQEMALRLGIDEVERMLRTIARDARQRYARILLGDDAGPPSAVSQVATQPACPHARHTEQAPPTPALELRGAQWALARLRDLPQHTPRRFVAGGVELVVVRGGDDVSVLHGRCPHRHAPLSDALVEDGRLVCPHHGWDFRLDTGRSEGVPGASVQRFDAVVQGGLVLVDAAELERYKQAYSSPFHDEDALLE